VLSVSEPKRDSSPCQNSGYRKSAVYETTAALKARSAGQSEFFGPTVERVSNSVAALFRSLTVGLFPKSRRWQKSVVSQST
jgi:hypothetical protein